MPVFARVFMPVDGTHQGNASFTPPGSYVQPIKSEDLRWRYISGGILLVVAVGGFVVAIYNCVAKRRKHAAERAARDAPAVDRPANAPVGPGLDVELGVIYRSPTRPDEGPDDAAQVQQGLDGPNEPAVVLREDLGFDAVGHGDTAGDAPVRSDMAVAGGGA